MSPLGRLDLLPGRYRVDVDLPTNHGGAFEVYVEQA